VKTRTKEKVPIMEAGA